MPIDINAIIAETRGKNFELYEEHINPVFVKVLRTLGFNRTWVRGEGAYLWDETGTRYLDFLTNWGVFNFGRRHPAIRNALQQVMDSEFPGWVGFDAPPLAAVLARDSFDPDLARAGRRGPDDDCGAVAQHPGRCPPPGRFSCARCGATRRRSGSREGWS